jgi:hypothetical protein
MSRKDLIGELFAKGAVIKVDSHIWSGTKKLNPIDIGLSDGDFNQNLVTLGSKFLIPHDEISKLNQIRSKATAIIDSNSMKFSFGSFIHNDKVEWVKEKLFDLKQKFADTVADIGNRYPELRKAMINEWQIEATSIASRKGDPQLVYMVMQQIEESFKTWDKIQDKFSFEIHEYRDINDVVKEFVAGQTEELINRFKEFADKLRERIESSNLNDKNLKPVRDFVDEIYQSSKILQNPDIDEALDGLAMISSEGNHTDLINNDRLKAAANKVLDSIDALAGEKLEEAKRKSVEMFTSHSRDIEM